MSSTIKRRDLFDRLHEQFLLTQRKMRWLRVNTPHTVDPLVSNVLPIICSRHVLTPSAISEFLLMHPSGVSRLLKHLEDSGYILRHISDADARVRSIALTPKGQVALHGSIALDRQIATAGLMPLNDREIEQLTVLFRQLADSFGAEREEPLPNELPFVTEQKRLARIKGMIGSSYLGTAYEIIDYQILFELWRSKTARRFKELSSVVPLEPSVLSRRLSRYVAEGVVESARVSGDKRGTSFTLTSHARSMFLAEDAKARARVAMALSDWSLADLKELLGLLARVTSNTPEHFETQTVRLLWCRSAGDWCKARAFVVEQLVARGEHLQLPGDLLSEEGIGVLALRSGVVVGAAYISPSKQLQYFEWRGVGAEAENFYSKVLERACRIMNISDLLLSDGVTKRWGRVFPALDPRRR